MARSPAVELHADVPDVRPFLAASGLMAVPLRVGGGSRLKILEALAAGLPVEWIGEQEPVEPFLGKLDLFAMVSEPAGCPNASLEAMAAGIPVVITNVGGASEQVEDGITGRLVPRGDIGALADALVELQKVRDAPLDPQWGPEDQEYKAKAQELLLSLNH